MSWKLKRTKQCAKCPWKANVNPHDIPDGYSVEKHKALSCTIAKNLEINSDILKVMSCHEHSVDEKTHCVGWLHNQLGVGNNISLRIKMMTCENAKEIKVFGPQHQIFEDTLPK